MRYWKMNRQNTLAVVLSTGLLVTAAFEAHADKPSTQTNCTAAWKSYKWSRSKFAAASRRYWNLISDKRKKRSAKIRKKLRIDVDDYVLKHPPEYAGRSRPKCPDPKAKPSNGQKKIKRKPIPVEADFLRAAKRLYGFEPQRVSERTFLRRYAREALKAGFTSQQVVGIYALETGGLGPYNRQSGIFNITNECKRIPPKGRAASTAIGYAQLIAPNSAVVADQKGEVFARQLEKRAARLGGKKAVRLRAKAKILRRMMRDIRAAIDKSTNKILWSQYVAYSKTQKGSAVHALNLDGDIGPMLQVQKLLKIKSVAERKGHENASAAKLELMNLIGYGRGLEMLRRPARNVPTANFMSPGGYQRNPVVKNKTSSSLLQSLDTIIQRNLKRCGSVTFLRVFADVKAGR